MVPKSVLKGGAAIVALVVLALLGNNMLAAHYRDGRIEANQERINAQEKAIGEHGQTLTEHTASLEEHERRLGEHDATLGEHGTAIEAQGKKLGEHEATLEIQSGQLGSVERDLSDQQRVVEELRTNAKEDREQLLKLEGKVRGLQEDLETSKAEQARQQQALENVLERLKTLEDRAPAAD